MLKTWPVLMTLPVDERRVALSCAELRARIARRLEPAASDFAFLCQYKNIIRDAKLLRREHETLAFYGSVYPAVTEPAVAAEADAFLVYPAGARAQEAGSSDPVI